MISEKKFSTTYNSFWNQLLPTGDSYLRRLNITCHRFCPPYTTLTTPPTEARAVINEMAFRLFMTKNDQMIINNKYLETLESKTQKYIHNLYPKVYNNIRKISSEEKSEVNVLFENLDKYFTDIFYEDLVFWPNFKGCGLIQGCNGDILNKDNLVEIKSGDRKFRIIDIRQVITYLALNYSSKQYRIDKVSLVNPRTGLAFSTDVEELILSCSGRKPIDVFIEIVNFISTKTPSF